jgi:hypothetical protein
MTWMKHAETGGFADLPELPYWRAQGWDPTDERPPEPDTLRDPQPEETTQAPAESLGLSAAKTKKSATAAKTEES